MTARHSLGQAKDLGLCNGWCWAQMSIAVYSVFFQKQANTVRSSVGSLISKLSV